MIKLIIAVLKLTGLTIPQIIQKARFIVQSITGNTYFTTPVPPLADITAAIDELEAAQNDVMSRIRGAVSIRKDKLLILKQLLENARNYVEKTANAQPAIAEGIVYSGGMEVKRPGGNFPQGFKAINSSFPGVIEVFSVVYPRATYEWMRTLTPNNDESWERVGLTHLARLMQSDLTSGTKYYYQVLVYAGNNPAIESPVISIVVL